MFSYIVLEIKDADYERVTDLVWGYKPLGVEEEKKENIKRFKVFFENQNRLQEFKNNLSNFPSYRIVEVGEIEREDWAKEWMRPIRPKRIGRDIIIYYDEIRRKKENKITLNIIPAMAFGTGFHESTIICLRMMNYLNLKNNVILDIGCGTGILSIFALLKGARKAIALDIDEFAIKETIRNALINKCLRKIILIQGRVNCLKNINFDLIVSNLTKEILLNEMEYIIPLMKRSGIWIFSGFTKEEKAQIKESLEKYFIFLRFESLRGWIAGAACGKRENGITKCFNNRSSSD